MFDRNLSQEGITGHLEPMLSVFTLEVIPERVELLDHIPYAQNYAWMYSFEKRLKYRIEDVLGHKMQHGDERILFGPGGVVSEGLSNAFAHGHRKDGSRPIEVWVAVSRKGLGFAITDQGYGFDIESVFERFKTKGAFFHIAGNGFSSFYHSEHFLVNYLMDGRQMCALFWLIEE